MKKRKLNSTNPKYYPVAETKQVKEGIENYQSIYELENKFYNAGKAQGSKFSMEQRVKTSF